MEAPLEAPQPIAVTDQASAATLQQAVRGAVDNLTRLIESTLGRAARSSQPANLTGASPPPQVFSAVQKLEVRISP